MGDMEPATPCSEYKAAFGTTLVLGGTGGLGGALIDSLLKGGCRVIATARAVNEHLETSSCYKIAPGIDVTDPDGPKKLIDQLEDTVLDTVIVVAGYFTLESLGNMNRDEQLKMFDICAIGPIRFVDALFSAGKLKEGTRIGFITSEGGSMGLRTLKEGGGNYGHHGSKAAQNMMCLMLAFDLQPKKIPVVMIHPGFLKTAMTADKYAQHYEEFGAVFAHEASPYILDCVARLTLETTGKFVSAMGSKGLGLGYYALPDPDNMKPGGFQYTPALINPLH